MELRKKILEILEKVQLAGFATINEEGKPWVRYVMTKGSDDMTVRFSTFVSARKVKQIEANPEVHLTMGVTDPEKMASYLQIQGKAHLTTDEAERHAFWIPMLEQIFKGPDDPEYGVIVVEPYRIELMNAGTFEPEIWPG